jgi:alpha-galactosidase
MSILQHLLTVVALHLLAAPLPVAAWQDGQARTPTLGWSSWNVAQCEAASERYALDTANNFVSLGLKDLGYTNVNIDDCWSTKSRDADGKLVPDPNKWPNGIRAVTDKIHEMGLKFGLYGCTGIMTCASYPGSQGHEYEDARQLAEWGIDFWKHDACFMPCNGAVPQTCWDPAIDIRDSYALMRDALTSVKETKEIVFNICQWGRNSVWEWGDEHGHSWRIEGDNWGDWVSVIRIGARASTIAQYSRPGGFNDLDMLFVGNRKLTENQERLHFGLWAIAKSPLIIGADLNNIPAASLNILKNKGIIDINQDRLGVPAQPFVPPGQPQPVNGQIYPYWAGPLSDGVVIGLSAANGAGTFNVNFANVPGLGSGNFSWKEMYSGRTGQGSSVSFSLGQHDFAVIKVTK